MINNAIAISGKSQKMKNVYNIANKVAATNVNILIEGEVGSGKKTLAQYIHEKSKSEGAFVALEQSIIKSKSLEYDIALKNIKEAFEKAHKGTLFINEISHAGENVQNILEDEIAGAKERNIRIIASTVRNLRDLARQKRFKHSLCDFLVVNIQIPSLRDRREDIPYLIEIFLKKFSPNHKTISKDALDMLLLYDWYGNVSELESALGHACALSEDGEINSSHFLAKLRKKTTATSMAGVPDELYKFALGLIDSGSHSDDFEPYSEYLKYVETPLIKAAMDINKGNKSAAAKALKINRNTINKKITDYKID